MLSQRGHAYITVDASPALAVDGVVDYVCINDVPGDNLIGQLLLNIVLASPVGYWYIPVQSHCVCVCLFTIYYTVIPLCASFAAQMVMQT